jgi:hypothetical protein
MPPGERELFTEAQRRSIGVCVAQLSELTQAVRGFGVGSAQLARIEETLASLAEATNARRPERAGNRLDAVLAHMLVLEEELRPQRLRAYGAVDPDGARILDRHVRQLVERTNELIAELRGAGR